MALIVGGIPITAPSGAQSGDQTGGPELPFLLFETSASMEAHPLLDGGNGTEENPYRFEDLTIRTPFRGIVVQDSHAHVVFRNITVIGEPVTDSEAENLTDEEGDIFYPLAEAVNLHVGNGDDPRKIRGIQLTNAENVTFENVVLDNIHQGVWLDAGSEMQIEQAHIVTDVFDEFAPVDSHLSRPLIVQMSGEEPEAGFVVREQSAVQASGVDLTLTGTGVNRTFADGTVTTYPTIGAFVIQDSTFEVDGFHVGKATIGAAAFNSDARFDDFQLTESLHGFETVGESSQYRFTNSTIVGGFPDILAKEAQGEIVDSTVNVVEATAKARWPNPDGAPTTALHMEDIDTAPGPIWYLVASLDGEAFTLDGYDATLQGQDGRFCKFNAAGTIRNAVIEDCAVDRSSRLGALDQNLRLENSHLIDSGVGISTLSRSHQDHNTTVLQDVVLDSSTIHRTCCSLAGSTSPGQLAWESIDVWFEDVTFRNSPQAIQFGWGWNATLRNVSFQNSEPTFALDKSPGATKVHASDITADGLPVITDGGHVSGGTYGGVLLPYDAEPTTITDGAEIRGFGIRAWGQEDLTIQDSVIRSGSFPIHGYRLHDLELRDTAIAAGSVGLCLEESASSSAENVSMPASGFAPGRCTDPTEITLTNVTTGGEPVLHNPTQPVTGEFGQILSSRGNVTVQDAHATGLPAAIIQTGGNLTIRNLTTDGNILWADGSSRIDVEDAASRLQQGPGARMADADQAGSWTTELTDPPIAVHIDNVPHVRLADVETTGAVSLDAVEDLDGFGRTSRRGQVHVSNLTVSGDRLRVENYEAATLEGLHSEAGFASALYLDDLEIRDSFYEAGSEMSVFGVGSLNVTDTTFEDEVRFLLEDPETRTGEPSLSPLVNDTWAQVEPAEGDVPSPEQLAAAFEAVRDLDRTFQLDPPGTFYELEQRIKTCEHPFGYCPVDDLYGDIVGLLVEPETTTATNAVIHRSNLLSTLLGDGKFNATNNWWGQAGGPREGQVQAYEFGTLEIDTQPAAGEPFNEPPSIDLELQGVPVANKTLLAHVDATDDNRDVEDVRVTLGDTTLDGSGPVTLPGPGPLAWSAKAVDGFGAVASEQGTIEVLPEPDATIHTAPDQPRVDNELKVHLEGPTESYDIVWDLHSDGSVDATGADATFVPEQAGTIALEARLNHDGQTVAAPLTHVTVSEPGQSPPNVTIEASPGTGQAPLTVDVDGQGFDNDGFLESWELRVDGDPVAQGLPPFPGHQLDLERGLHTVTLAYTDDDNLTGAASTPVSVDTAPVTIEAATLRLDDGPPKTWIGGERPTLAIETSDADAASVHLEACVSGEGSLLCSSSTEATGPATLELPSLPVGPVDVEIEAWDGQGTTATSTLSITTVANAAPRLDPSTPTHVEAGEPVELVANAVDPEHRPLSTAWTTPWTSRPGDNVTVEPEGWGLETVTATATDPFGETTTRTQVVEVDAALQLEGDILPVGPNGYAVPLRTSWIGAGAVHADVSAQLTWNGLVLDEDQARTGPSGVTILYLEDRTQGTFPSGYQVTVDARTPSPPDDAEPGLERASLTMEVTP